ncbi:hypothetical protein [Cytobacillus pseudoceanisediminis]|uniref:hypothetical protein n=1 Tax=Cytobacillus pseudoceanisediminis TaxID=3051614 RepID=UPI003C2CE5FC
MVKKVISIFIVGMMLLSFTYTPEGKVTAAEASASKVWWDGAELKPGQIGRVTILKENTLFMLDGRNLEPVRKLHPGEVYRVYSAKTPDGYVPMYGVGGKYYVVQNVYPNNTGHLKYETPSKSKLALVKQ